MTDNDLKFAEKIAIIEDELHTLKARHQMHYVLSCFIVIYIFIIIISSIWWIAGRSVNHVDARQFTLRDETGRARAQLAVTP